jgi:hypothetical protein
MSGSKLANREGWLKLRVDGWVTIAIKGRTEDTIQFVGLATG